MSRNQAKNSCHNNARNNAKAKDNNKMSGAKSENK